jgi:hypothetical protein
MASLGGSLAAVALLMTLPSLGALNEVFAKQSEVYGVYVIGYLILLAALAVILRQASRAERRTMSVGVHEDPAEALAA